jgi:hypothetical protein
LGGFRTPALAFRCTGDGRHPKTFTMAVVPTSGTASPKMVYRGGCATEYAEYLERSPSTYDEQIGVAWPQEARKER